ncbi:MAG: hypothetical protein ACFHVJ_17170 [Aestuariibacter sp.]
MWFVFGIITLTSFCVYQAYKRINAGWEGETARIRDLEYQYKFEKIKGDIQAVKIGIDATQGFDFTFKREGSIDRFFKHIGVTEEHQIGNSKFDDLVYVLSDDKLLHLHISNNEKLVRDTIKLFSYSDGSRNKVKELRCNSGRLWITYSTPDDFDEQEAPFLAKKLIPHIRAIAKDLSVADFRDTAKGKDPFIYKAAVILAISSGLLLNGFIQTYRIEFNEIPFIIDTDLLLTDTIILSIVIVIALVFVALKSLGRSARTHLVLIELLLAGCLGTGLTAHAQLRDLNMEMDDSEWVEFVVTTHNKTMSKSRRSTRYYLYVDDWTTDNRATHKKIEVPSSLYHSANIGGKLLLGQHAGYLDYRWVSSITVF